MSVTTQYAVDRIQQQRCKVCWSANGFCFQVPDDIWEAVLPVELQCRVVCLACFDAIASEKNIEYASYIEQLCFAGRNIGLYLKIEHIGREK